MALRCGCKGVTFRERARYIGCTLFPSISMQKFFFRCRQILAFSLGLGFVLQPIFARAAFSDISRSDAKTAIETLAERGILEGYGDGTFKPDATINRAEFVHIIAKALKFGDDNRTSSNCFPDVGSEWFADDVCEAQTRGIIGGYPDGMFHPEREINFVEASKIIALAYKTQAQGGGEWYEPYARALDSSKAIPPSVEGLDRPITRAEMTEMMWRLGDNLTDQPSQGYLNLKYPDVAVNLSSDDIQNAKSCTDLQALAQEGQNTGAGMYYRGGMLMEGDMAAGAPAPTAAQNKSAVANDGSYSTTNVQVEGVDEGDTVKTDGTYIYLIKDQTVRIVKATPASGMQELAMIDLAETGMSPTDLYIENNVLTVIGPHYAYSIQQPMPMEKRMMAPDTMIYPGYSKAQTDVRLYDVTDHTNPKLKRKITFDGSSVSTRKIEDRLYLILQQPMMWAYPMPLTRDAASVLPMFQDSAKGTAEMPVTDCAKVAILPHPIAPQYITVATVPLTGSTKEVKREVVVGNAQTIYASLDNLYVATTEWKYHWDPVAPKSSENTHLYRFAFTDDGVDFAAKGSVPGHLLNQFSMDEHGQTFRVAVTEGQTWDEKNFSKNALYVLNRDMKITGTLTDLAPGEQIYSVRFMGNRAYIVTFKTVDPLFVIDTTDPRNPKVLGALKIPGYSNYLHPYDEKHIIGFGKDVDESIDKDKVHTPGAIYYTAVQGMKIALFDVTDPANPKEKSKVIIGDRGTDSPLLYDHKALYFDKERNLFSFPITVYEKDKNQSSSVGSDYTASPVFQGAYVYSLSLTDGFKYKGNITHYDSDTFTKAGQYWYGGDRDVSRVLRIGESLYSVSRAAVQAHGIANVNKLGGIELEIGTDVTY